METTLIHLPSTRKHRLIAAAMALLVLAAAMIVWPHSRQSAAIVPAFLPIFSTWVSLTEGLTAFLLWTQYRISGRLVFAVLGGAYAFTSVVAAIQLLVFPACSRPTGLLAAGSQAAVWIRVFWHGGFPALLSRQRS